MVHTPTTSLQALSEKKQILISVSMGIDRFFIKQKCLEGMSAFTHMCNSIKSQADCGSAWHMSGLLASAVAVTGAALRYGPLKDTQSGRRSQRSYSQVSLLGWFVSEGALGNGC